MGMEISWDGGPALGMNLASALFCCDVLDKCLVIFCGSFSSPFYYDEVAMVEYNNVVNN